MLTLPARVCIVVCPNLDGFHTNVQHDYVTYLITPYAIVDYPKYEMVSYWINRYGAGSTEVLMRACVECRKKGIKSP